MVLAAGSVPAVSVFVAQVYKQIPDEDVETGWVTGLEIWSTINNNLKLQLGIWFKD